MSNFANTTASGLFAIAFTKRRPNQIKKTTYAASSQIRAIRKKMTEIIQREATSCTLSQLVSEIGGKSGNHVELH